MLEKDYGIQCEICKSYHAKCVDISVEVYTYLERSKNLHWFCDLCNRRVAQVMEEIIRLKGRQEIIEQEIAVVKNEIEEMKKDINKTDTNLDTAIETKLLDVVENKVEENVVENKVESKVDKSMDIERRRCNLVIHGIDENSDDGGPFDDESVEEIMKALRCPPRSVEEVIRIGRRVDGKVRPLRIKLRLLEAKTEVLKRAKLLKENENFKRVFIQLDLTLNQQKVDKVLRDKLGEMRAQGETEAKIAKL